MADRRFAAIDVGSFDLEMGIYEIDERRGIRLVDSVRHVIALGSDTYNTGMISFELVEELVDVLRDFTEIMRTYKVSTYRAYATSALREAKNRILVLDKIRVRTGLEVKVISNAEARFLSYKALAAQGDEFNRIAESGTAIADLLFGKESPSGRLPLGFPEKTEDLPPFDDYEMAHGRTYMYRKVKPLYEFGFGLSYTRFAYSDLRKTDDGVEVTVNNVGEMEADEVVEVYIDSAGLPDQPRLRLKGFQRIRLKPGESKAVRVPLDDESFSLFGEDGVRRVYPGTYRVYADGRMPDERSLCLTVRIPSDAENG